MIAEHLVKFKAFIAENILLHERSTVSVGPQWAYSIQRCGEGLILQQQKSRYGRAHSIQEEQVTL